MHTWNYPTRILHRVVWSTHTVLCTPGQYQTRILHRVVWSTHTVLCTPGTTRRVFYIALSGALTQCCAHLELPDAYSTSRCLEHSHSAVHTWNYLTRILHRVVRSTHTVLCTPGTTRRVFYIALSVALTQCCAHLELPN
ncbi:hypothetical protein BaRGS_00037082, partial [Batillaria attramentaria]